MVDRKVRVEEVTIWRWVQRNAPELYRCRWAFIRQRHSSRMPNGTGSVSVRSIFCSPKDVCTIERDGETLYVRLGLNYGRGFAPEHRTEHGGSAEPANVYFATPLSAVRSGTEQERNGAALAELGALNALPEYAADRSARSPLAGKRRRRAIPDHYWKLSPKRDCRIPLLL
jgi:hypothetical protein